MKQLQISQELFMKLCRFHLLEEDSEKLRREICEGLEDKLNRAVAREEYSKQILERKR